MVRWAAALAVFLSATIAFAAGEPYTFTVPPDWRDATEEASKLSSIEAQAQEIKAAHGRTQTSAYVDRNGPTEIFLTYSTFDIGEPDRRQLEVLDAAARKEIAAQGTEGSYHVEWGPKLGITTQRLTAPRPITMRRIMGFGPNGTVMVIVARCLGTDAACDEVLRGLTPDLTRFRALDSLDELHEGMSVARIGQIIGGASILLLLGAIALKRRKSAAAR